MGGPMRLGGGRTTQVGHCVTSVAAGKTSPKETAFCGVREAEGVSGIGGEAKRAGGLTSRHTKMEMQKNARLSSMP